MGCATGTVKYLIFLANFVFALAGLALIVLGCIFKISFESKLSDDSIPTAFSAISVITIIVGSIIFITSFFGCCGALRESTCMITTYSIILLTFFIIQLAIGVFAFLQVKDSDDFHKDLRNAMKKPFENYSKNKIYKDEVDVLQQIFECCGLDGPKYWTLTFPTSCCKDQSKTCMISSKDLYEEGCVDEMYDFLEKSSSILGYVIIGIAVTELVGAIIGLCLVSSIRNQQRRGNYS